MKKTNKSQAISKKRPPLSTPARKSTLKTTTALPVPHVAMPKWIFGIVVALSFVFYGNTIFNHYALDDTMVLTQNEFVKRGVNGIPKILKYDTFLGRYGEIVVNLPGGRYRPLSLITLAIEYDIFTGAETKQIIQDKLDQKQNDDETALLIKTPLPYVNHFMNILMFAITACVLLIVMLRLFPQETNTGWKLLFNIPVLTTILYVTHPVHSEVVANIKGRDEIMTFLGALCALYFTLKWLDTKQLKFLGYSFLSFLFGLFSKENAITFLLIIPLTVHFFTNYSIKRNFISMLPLLLAAFIFLAARAQAINSDPLPETELMNNPFMLMTSHQKWASIIYVLGRYLLLQIFPYPLTTDYYPYHIPTMNFGDPSVIFFTLFYLALGVFTVWGIFKKNKYAYAVIWFIVPLSVVSNIFVQIGTFMNERFIYISSVGFCMVLADFLIDKLSKWLKKEVVFRTTVAAFMIVLLCLYGIDTIARNRVWYDDFTLSTTDVKISTESAKANYDAARVYNIKFQQTTDEAERDTITRLINKYSRRAVELHPFYENALLLLSWSNGALGQPPDSSVKYLLQLIRRNPQNPFVFEALTFSVSQYPDPARRTEIWEYVLKLAPQRFEPNYNLACIYAKEQGRIPESLPFFEKAVALNAEHVAAHIDLGAIYGYLGRPVKSIEMFEKAIQLAPTDTLAYKNLWATYATLGDQVKAQEAYNKFMQVKTQLLQPEQPPQPQ